MSKTVLFQTVPFNISTIFCFHTVKCKNSSIKTIQFSISTQFNSIRRIDKSLSDATTLRQSGPGSDGKKGVFCFSQSYSISGAPPSDCLVSYLGHSLRERLTSLQRSSRCLLQPELTVPLKLFVSLIYLSSICVFKQI